MLHLSLILLNCGHNHIPMVNSLNVVFNTSQASKNMVIIHSIIVVNFFCWQSNCFLKIKIKIKMTFYHPFGNIPNKMGACLEIPYERLELNSCAIFFFHYTRL
jgi:hypothetical protein